MSKKQSFLCPLNTTAKQLFFRVLPDLSIADLRADIVSQLETEVLPSNFVFVRGVGRHFTEVSFFQKCVFLCAENIM